MSGYCGIVVFDVHVPLGVVFSSGGVAQLRVRSTGIDVGEGGARVVAVQQQRVEVISADWAPGAVDLQHYCVTHSRTHSVTGLHTQLGEEEVGRGDLLVHSSVAVAGSAGGGGGGGGGGEGQQGEGEREREGCQHGEVGEGVNE